MSYSIVSCLHKLQACHNHELVVGYLSTGTSRGGSIKLNNKNCPHVDKMTVTLPTD